MTNLFCPNAREAVVAWWRWHVYRVPYIKARFQRAPDALLPRTKNHDGQNFAVRSHAVRHSCWASRSGLGVWLSHQATVQGHQARRMWSGGEWWMMRVAHIIYLVFRASRNNRVHMFDGEEIHNIRVYTRIDGERLFKIKRIKHIDKYRVIYLNLVY